VIKRNPWGSELPIEESRTFSCDDKRYVLVSDLSCSTKMLLVYTWKMSWNSRFLSYSHTWHIKCCFFWPWYHQHKSWRWVFWEASSHFWINFTFELPRLVRRTVGTLIVNYFSVNHSQCNITKCVYHNILFFLNLNHLILLLSWTRVCSTVLDSPLACGYQCNTGKSLDPSFEIKRKLPFSALR
jgi:hypothetical protein